MHELRHCVGPAESLVEKHVERSRGEPFLTADHVAHLHEVVIYNVCEMICGELICTLIEHFIIEDVAIDHHFATDEVVDFHIAVGLNLEANHILMALVDEALSLLSRHGEGVAHGAACGGVILEIGDALAGLLELFGSVESYVGFSGIKKLFHIFFINVATFALLVGAIFATFAHTFVEMDAEPMKGIGYVFLGPGHEATAVGVFNSENHVAPVLAGEDIVVESGAHTADVERPRRRRSKSYSYFAIHA